MQRIPFKIFETGGCWCFLHLFWQCSSPKAVEQDFKATPVKNLDFIKASGKFGISFIFEWALLHFQIKDRSCKRGFTEASPWRREMLRTQALRGNLFKSRVGSSLRRTWAARVSAGLLKNYFMLCFWGSSLYKNLNFHRETKKNFKLEGTLNLKLVALFPPASQRLLLNV